MKRFINLALGMAITLSIPTSSLAAGTSDFTDVDYSTDYYHAIGFTEDQGIFKGNDDGTFSPTKKLNRAEMAMLLMRLEFLDDNLLHPILPQLECQKKEYPDVEQDSWYEIAVYRAQCTGLMVGDDGGTFRPTDSLTAAEVMTIFYRAYDKYSDNTNGENWYLPGLNWSEDRKIIPPTIKGLNHEVTRAEMARFFEKLWQDKMGYNIGKYDYLTAQEVLDGQPNFHEVSPVENPYPSLANPEDWAILKAWANEGSLPADLLADHPLPWNLEDEWKEGNHIIQLLDANSQLIADNQGNEDVPLFAADLLNRHRQSLPGAVNYIYPSDWKMLVDEIGSIPNDYTWSTTPIDTSENWLTLPYREGYVGALNFETGAFILHQIKTSNYSQAVADKNGVVYTENNAWACLSNEQLAKAGIKLDVYNTPCQLVYEGVKGEVTVLNETVGPFLDGMYNYYLRMTPDHVFVFDSIWECYQFCPPRISIYTRLNNGTVEHQESWNYGPNGDENYVENAEYFKFGHYTEADGWTTYQVPAFTMNDDIAQVWQDFWDAHPELTNPYSLFNF